MYIFFFNLEFLICMIFLSETEGKSIITIKKYMKIVSQLENKTEIRRFCEI